MLWQLRCNSYRNSVLVFFVAFFAAILTQFMFIECSCCHTKCYDSYSRLNGEFFVFPHAVHRKIYMIFVKSD